MGIAEGILEIIGSNLKPMILDKIINKIKLLYLSAKEKRRKYWIGKQDIL